MPNGIKIQELLGIILLKHTILVYRIIVQDGINVQAGKITKINKRAGWNKAVQVGIFHFLLVKIKVLVEFSQN